MIFHIFWVTIFHFPVIIRYMECMGWRGSGRGGCWRPHILVTDDHPFYMFLRYIEGDGSDDFPFYVKCYFYMECVCVCVCVWRKPTCKTTYVCRGFEIILLLVVGLLLQSVAGISEFTCRYSTAPLSLFSVLHTHPCNYKFCRIRICPSPHPTHSSTHVT